jgi:hypothetical protein
MFPQSSTETSAADPDARMHCEHQSAGATYIYSKIPRAHTSKVLTREVGAGNGMRVTFDDRGRM